MIDAPFQSLVLVFKLADVFQVVSRDTTNTFCLGVIIGLDPMGRGSIVESMTRGRGGVSELIRGTVSVDLNFKIREFAGVMRNSLMDSV